MRKYWKDNFWLRYTAILVAVVMGLPPLAVGFALYCSWILKLFPRPL